MTQPNGTVSQSVYVLELARELLDDIELGRLTTSSLVLKAARLARLAGTDEDRAWLHHELHGYNDQVPTALKYMGYTGRWIDMSKKQGYWGSVFVQEADLGAARARMAALRVPDLNYAVSSSNPNEYVSGGVLHAGAGDRLAVQLGSIVNTIKQASDTVQALSRIIGQVTALLHRFALSVYYSRAFSNLTETIFEQHKSAVDIQLRGSADDVLQKLPAIYDRLAVGDKESISQALTTVRRLIDSFANSVFPPRETPLVVDGITIQLGPNHTQNRINAFIIEKCESKSRRLRLRQTLSNIYDRVSTGVHDEVSRGEARALLVETYLFLGEVLELGVPGGTFVKEGEVT